jgi:hypothetical protein
VSRGSRVTLTLFALAAAFSTVPMLTSLSTRTEGPLSATLDSLGSGLDSLEYAVRERFTSPGRSRSLDWFTRSREEPARLRHPDAFLLGAYEPEGASVLDGITALERRLGTTFPLVQFYTAWGDQPEHQFPLRTATSIWNAGSVPVITWEPWLAVFDGARHPHLPLQSDRARGGMAAVARGDYDFYVGPWAAAAAAFGRPLFLRFAHEMNDPYRYSWGPQHNTKEEYIAAWRHVVNLFRAAGAHNVVWVWSPHVAYEYWDLYYPGDEYVDWAATGVLNYGPIAQWSRWWTFEEIFGRKYPRMAEFGKPIMIAEFGSLAVGGDRAGWYRDALLSLSRDYPQVRALLLFHSGSDQTVTYQAVDWRVTSEPATLSAVSDAIGSLTSRTDSR